MIDWYKFYRRKNTILEQSCADPVVVLESSNKRFVVTEDQFLYSNFHTGCAAINAEVAVVDSNAEFIQIQTGVYDNEITKRMEIYISVTKSGSGNGATFSWASEVVSNHLWWAQEPNRRGLQPDSGFEYACMGISNHCRPITMSCFYSYRNQWSTALLMDTCCRRRLTGLCMQDVDECEDENKNSCPDNSECVNLKYSYRCDCEMGFEKDVFTNQCIVGRLIRFKTCRNWKDATYTERETCHAPKYLRPFHPLGRNRSTFMLFQ
ncbi:hypothetical protein RRG08_058006 [Elysia crispata]|uniref:EGF-like domain-containing protein n=1 Tax=Elysia crispata TaxID=231223 RepID=A0AAE1E3L8_9GAST|nr:hypothetical protein RRG08_058006 [Elysia crispata]